MSLLTPIPINIPSIHIPLPNPQKAYELSEIERALPGWVGTGAGIGAVILVTSEAAVPMMLILPVAGGAAGAIGGTTYGAVIGGVKRLLGAGCPGRHREGKEDFNEHVKRLKQGLYGGGIGGVVLRMVRDGGGGTGPLGLALGRAGFVGGLAGFVGAESMVVLLRRVDGGWVGVCDRS